MTARNGRMVGLCLAVMLSTLAFTPAQAQQQYRAYHNDRYGVSADVPRDWRAGPPPENGDGLRFTSPDGAATIVISGGFNLADTIAQAMNDEQAADEGETITYRSKTLRMSVVSGTRGGSIFYRKATLSCRDQIINRLSIEYPAARKEAFDALVTHVAGSLRPGSGFQTDRCR